MGDQHDSKHDELVRTVERALNELEQAPAHPHKMTAGAVPSWLSAILTAAVQALGPALITALQQLLTNLANQQNPPASNPTDTTGA